MLTKQIGSEACASKSIELKVDLVKNNWTVKNDSALKNDWVLKNDSALKNDWTLSLLLFLTLACAPLSSAHVSAQVSRISAQVSAAQIPAQSSAQAQGGELASSLPSCGTGPSLA